MYHSDVLGHIVFQSGAVSEDFDLGPTRLLSRSESLGSGWLICVVALVNVFVVWEQHRSVNQRIGTFVGTWAMDARPEGVFIYRIVLALVDVEAYALGPAVLHCARMLPKNLHVGLGHGVVLIE
jgi:hypothetical protein